MTSKALPCYDLGKRGRYFRWQEEGRKEEERAAGQRKRCSSAEVAAAAPPPRSPGAPGFPLVQEMSPQPGGWHPGGDPPRPWGCRPGSGVGSVPTPRPCLTRCCGARPLPLSISTPFGGPNLCQPAWPPSPSPSPSPSSARP